jgi:anthranilate phosphoribosyltransferase
MDFQQYQQAAQQQSGLTAATMEAACAVIFNGQAVTADIAEFLRILAERGETAAELIGLVRALHAHAVPFPAAPSAVDVCGTGGDGHNTVNISTAVAFTVAGCGVRVVKHGNRAATSKSGSADVLEALGVKIDAAPELSQLALERANICFLFAPLYHPAMRHVAEARRLVGRRTIFNLAGPLANPAKPQRQLVGVFHHDWLSPIAESLRVLGGQAAWVVHSRDGMDELSLAAVADIAQLRHGTITMTSLNPTDYGLQPPQPNALQGGDAATNATTIRNLLAGATGAVQDIVALNAAAALVIAERAPTIEAGITMARHALTTGAAQTALDQLIAITNGNNA